MKLIYRLFWCGLVVFLLSFLLGIFSLANSTDDSSLGAIGLMGMLAGAALFGLCAVVIENDDGEESKAMHAARCWHCSSALNSDIGFLLNRAKAAESVAEETTKRLMSRALEQSLATQAELTEHELHELVISYPAMLVEFKKEQEQITNILKELASCARECASLLVVSREVETITRPTFAATGRWRTGREVAGQYLLASEVEPQQVTVVLARALPITANQIAAALRELSVAQELARRHLDGFSRFLTQSEI